MGCLTYIMRLPVQGSIVLMEAVVVRWLPQSSKLSVRR